MKRYEVTFIASRSGTIRHFIRASRKKEAKARIEAAYPGQEITFLKVARR